MGKCAKLCTVNDMTRPFLADGFLLDDECLACVWAMDAGVREESEVLGSDVEPRFDIRRAETIDVERAVLALVEERLDRYRDRVARHFGLSLTAREGAGFVRYLPGGFYRPHVDWTDSAAWPDAARRQVAAVVFLGSSTDGDEAGCFDGGTLRLYVEGAASAPVDVVPRRGMMAAFPATMLHEVTVVQRGVRDAIVDWYY
jgi:predicted 2-oxoglutarate/Fe(II)-dependent dioxygenase YbiX